MILTIKVKQEIEIPYEEVERLVLATNERFEKPSWEKVHIRDFVVTAMQEGLVDEVEDFDTDDEWLSMSEWLELRDES